MSLYPFLFHPILKERVWGGRNLERLYHKVLPPGATVGESWEITDRVEGLSVIANGPLAGRNLRWLMEHHQAEVLGQAASSLGRYPLLVKILDSQQNLSLQVHPPAQMAAQLGGEPKTEMWQITHAKPGAEIFLGLRRGITRAVFEEHLQRGTLADCFHRLKVQPGDAAFLPSGRVHALGAGLVLFEVQQNSDTTYRVFDWNRMGLDGRPRELHLPQALASIDFSDAEPALIQTREEPGPGFTSRHLVNDRLFSAQSIRLVSGAAVPLRCPRSLVIGVVHGRLVLEPESVDLSPGRFCLVPASLEQIAVTANREAEFLVAEPGEV